MDSQEFIDSPLFDLIVYGVFGSVWALAVFSQGWVIGGALGWIPALVVSFGVSALIASMGPLFTIALIISAVVWIFGA